MILRGKISSTMATDSLAVASAHYHAGRFGQAADTFRGTIDRQDGIVAANERGGPKSGRKRKLPSESSSFGTCASTRPTGTATTVPTGNIFLALPSLSVEADAALSAARSALARSRHSTGSNGKGGNQRSPVEPIKSALEANARYQNALLSASLALRRSEAADGYQISKGNSNDKGFTYEYVTSRSRRQVAISFLMAATSASWLHMAVSDMESAEKVVEDAIVYAASCFWCDTTCGVSAASDVSSSGTVTVLPPAMLPITIQEAYHLLKRALGGPFGSTGMGAGGPTDCNLDDMDDDIKTVEAERCEHALRTFGNATRAVRLGGDNNSDRLTDMDVDTEKSSKGKAELAAAAGESHHFIEDGSLLPQELLTRALLAHRNVDRASPSDAEKKKEGLKKRDQLIERAASLEVDRGYSSLGLARKVQILLDGLKLLSVLSKDNTPPLSTAGSTVAGLKSLASSASRTAHIILGHIYAVKGDHSLAIDSWQKALAMEEKRGTTVGSRDYRGTYDTSTPIAVCVRAESRLLLLRSSFQSNNNSFTATVLSTAKSFALLGEARPSEEFLLHLVSDASCARGLSSASDKDDKTAKKIILHGNEGAANRVFDGKWEEERSILWQLYHISTLAEDWATGLAAAEALAAGVDNNKTLLDDTPMARAALIFAILQCHRHSLAMEKCVEWKDQDVKGALGALFDLFEADALITSCTVGMSTEESAKGGSIESVQAIFDKCEAAVDKVENELNEDNESDDDGSGSLDIGIRSELGIATDNNRGISFVLTGKVKEALAAFEEASIDRLSIKSQDMSWLLLRPRFNLALLLWREGHRHEATKVWMGTRKFGPQAREGNECQTKDLSAILQEAISRHGLYCAKKKAPGPTCTHGLITPWLPTDDTSSASVSNTGECGTHFLGVNMEQVLAFDVVVLQHAVTERSKRESREFNSNFGR